MGKFERKIRNQMKNDIEDFDVWFEKNQEKLTGFTSNNTNYEMENNGAVKKKTAKKWLIPLVFFLATVCVILCFLPMMRQEKTPTHFGDDRVYEEVINEEGISTIIQENPFLSLFTYTGGSRLLKKDDESLVFIMLSGELETELDYYFVTVQIEYDPYYDFLSKPFYAKLKKQKEVNGFYIRYDLPVLDGEELNWYRMLTQKDGQTIYWEIHCFEESIEQFIELIFE